MADVREWRRRFYLFLAARLVGLLAFLLGMAIAFTGLVRAGGWPQFGLIVLIAGLAEAVVAPVLLKRRWRNEDAGK